MTIHPKVRLARILTFTGAAQKAVEAMFENVYEATAELEALGIFGLADVLDKAAEDMRLEIATIATAARAEMTNTPPPTSPTPAAPAARA